MSLEHSWAQIERQSCGASTSEISSKKFEGFKASNTDKRSLISEISRKLKKLSPPPKVASKRPGTRPSTPKYVNVSTLEKMCLRNEKKIEVVKGQKKIIGMNLPLRRKTVNSRHIQYK